MQKVRLLDHTYPKFVIFVEKSTASPEIKDFFRFNRLEPLTANGLSGDGRGLHLS